MEVQFSTTIDIDKAENEYKAVEVAYARLKEQGFDEETLDRMYIYVDGELFS